ncbi:hypothetical protein VTH06DRAFT_7897 [Thermothelomyces fergusii]
MPVFPNAIQTLLASSLYFRVEHFDCEEKLRIFDMTLPRRCATTPKTENNQVVPPSVYLFRLCMCVFVSVSMSPESPVLGRPPQSSLIRKKTGAGSRFLLARKRGGDFKAENKKKTPATVLMFYITQNKRMRRTPKEKKTKSSRKY